MRVGLFLDTGSLYHVVKPRKVDYSAIMHYAKDLGTVEVANAYGVDLGKGSANFRTKLGELGYVCKFKEKGNANVELSLDSIMLAGDLDCVILGSADESLGALVRVLTTQGKEVMCVGLEGGISIGIPESFLMESDV